MSHADDNGITPEVRAEIWLNEALDGLDPEELLELHAKLSRARGRCYGHALHDPRWTAVGAEMITVEFPVYWALRSCLRVAQASR